jgi:hypothetical protein
MHSSVSALSVHTRGCCIGVVHVALALALAPVVRRY